MRYSISNAIPHNPKSKKHPYETLAKIRVFGESGLTDEKIRKSRADKRKASRIVSFEGMRIKNEQLFWCIMLQ